MGDRPGSSDPAGGYAQVTPSDSVNLTEPSRSLFIGGAGNVAAVRMDGTAVTFTNVGAGTILPIIARRVNATNTTATNIVALW